MKEKLIVFFICHLLQLCSSNWQESPPIADLFAEAKLNGTFVLFDVQTGKFTGYNEARARRRFVPASTFKIANSLIGLSTQAVKSVDHVLPYGGQPQPFALWEKDMGLREAIAVSNVPIYQELARRIGLGPMQAAVEKLNYGNQTIGQQVDNFWLKGPLKISAVEQTKFLARLAQGKLPISTALQKSVGQIVLLEQGHNWQLYGKTGWTNAPKSGVGWWVGWVRKEGRLYAFALNMDIEKPAQAPLRLQLGKASLAKLGVL